MSCRVVVAVAACVLVLAGCQQGGSGIGPTAPITAPSSVAMAVDVPFSGAVTGGLTFVANPQNCPSGVTGVSDATGTALHMGTITYHTEQCVNAALGITGKALVLTAANGDELHGTFVGQSTAPGETGTQIQVSATLMFEGGTGRFENATGTAEMTAVLTHSAAFPWPGRWQWSGTIRY
jgi:hypothetical protein